jgi:TIR domain
MSGQIFISYRRDDASHPAGRLYDHLAQKFPKSRIFMDINLDPGEDFADAIEKSVGSCDILIAIIGRHWVDGCDADGNRRLDKQGDFVRLEISTALKRGIRVMPVLVDGAVMPGSNQLPEDLQPITRRQAVDVSHKRFATDSEGIIQAINRAFEKAESAEKRQSERTSRSEAVPGEPTQAKTPSLVQSKGSTWPEPSVRVKVFATSVLILIVGLIWFTSRGGREAALVMSAPTPTAVPTASSGAGRFREAKEMGYIGSGLTSNSESTPTPTPTATPTLIPTPMTASGGGVVVSGVNAGRDANVTVNAERSKSPGRAIISDILVDPRPDHNAVVDFRVTNKGELPVSISRVRFRVLAVKTMKTLGFLHFSAKYDLDISDLERSGQTAEVAVAHELSPGETDRFALVLTARRMRTGEFRQWCLEPTLVTSNGDEPGEKTITFWLP